MKHTKNDNNNSAELAYDGSNATTSSCGDEFFFHATFNPPHHYMGRDFTATKYVFASLTVDSITIAAYRPAGIQPDEAMKFVMPRYIADGKYPIDNSNQNLPHARIYSNGGAVYSGKEGDFEFTLDRASSIIQAKFNLTVITEEKEYPLEGNLKLKATAPI